MRVLILTGKFGMGHYSASLSLCQQLTAAFPGARVEVEDFYAYALPNASEAMYKFFNLLVTRGSGLYNAFYKHTENGRPDQLPVYALPLVEQMGQLVRERRPDAVIATHPLCAQLLSRYKEAVGDRLPLITCVTDMTAHAEWLCSGTDRYLVGAPHIRTALIRKGVAPEKILVTGLPVKAEFKLPPRRADSRRRELLIMGGGLGLLPRGSAFYAQLNALPHLHTTVICGGNDKLYRRLHGKYENIEVLGFTGRVYDYMASAHLMLSKPGGITLFEAISSQLPILAWEPFLEQERRNADFLRRYRVGRIAPKDPVGCLAAIRDLIYDQDTLAAMSRRCAALQRELADQGLTRLMSSLETAQKGAVAS